VVLFTQHTPYTYVSVICLLSSHHSSLSSKTISLGNLWLLHPHQRSQPHLSSPHALCLLVSVQMLANLGALQLCPSLMFFENNHNHNTACNMPSIHVNQLGQNCHPLLLAYTNTIMHIHSWGQCLDYSKLSNSGSRMVVFCCYCCFYYLQHQLTILISHLYQFLSSFYFWPKSCVDTCTGAAVSFSWLRSEQSTSQGMWSCGFRSPHPTSCVCWTSHLLTLCLILAICETKTKNSPWPTSAK
jgi:hypothetical protein